MRMKFERQIKVISFILVTFFIIGAATGCGNPKEKPIVDIEMEDGSKMVLELYPEFAPKTVKNYQRIYDTRR